MFKRYIKSNNKEHRVLLMLLLLNNYSMKDIIHLEDAKEDKQFGLKYRKIYGITEEFVDEKKIEQELEAIKTPIIYSPQTFELYANCPTIHVFTPELEEKPMVINDMGMISNEMIITRKCIVSEEPARRLNEIPPEECGFMFFVDYVLKEEIYIGKWHIIFRDKCFAINYISTLSDGQTNEETLYMAIEIDKTSTYRLVIYIIKKVSEQIENWKPDNYIDEVYELIG